jgi:hypothetical protein
MFAQQALGWKPAEFWAATVYEFETAVLARERQMQPPTWTDEQTQEFFDRLG